MIRDFMIIGVTIVMMVLALLLGAMLPRFWQQAEDLGGIKATLRTIESKLDAIDKRIDGVDKRIESLDKRIDGVDRSIAQVSSDVKRIDDRLSGRDIDPGYILAKSGLRPSSEFYAAVVGTKLFAFPKTDDASAQLARLGARQEAVSSSLSGWVIGKVDSNGSITLEFK